MVINKQKLFLNCYDNVFEEKELDSLLKAFDLNKKHSKEWYGTYYVQINGYFKNI